MVGGVDTADTLTLTKINSCDPDTLIGQIKGTRDKMMSDTIPKCSSVVKQCYFI